MHSQPRPLHAIGRQLAEAVGRLDACAGAVCHGRTADARLQQPLHKDVHEHAAGVEQAERAPLRRPHVALQADAVAVLHPVARHAQRPRGGPVAARVVLYRIIRGRGVARDQRREPPPVGHDGQLEHALVQHQRREVGLIGRRSVVPQPARAPVERVLHRHVAHDAAVHHADAPLRQAADELLQVVRVELGVEAAHHVEVAPQRVARHAARGPQLRAERLHGPRLCQRRDGRHHLHGRGGARQLVGLMFVERASGREVVDADTRRGAPWQTVLYDCVEAGAQQAVGRLRRLSPQAGGAGKEQQGEQEDGLHQGHAYRVCGVTAAKIGKTARPPSPWRTKKGSRSPHSPIFNSPLSAYSGLPPSPSSPPGSVPPPPGVVMFLALR